MSIHSPCPEINRLEALLGGNLPTVEQVFLEAHLKTCETCRASLDELTGQVGLLSESGRREVSEGNGPNTALRGAMSRLKAAGPESAANSADTPTAAEQPGVEGISLDFLDPPSQPHCLGQLGEYEITGVVGHGGMGVVLKGRDPALNRYVAIKVLSPQLASSAVAGNRFMREAQMAAAVSHDHVVTIHAVNRAKGLPFLVMEYIAGVSLEERIRRTGPLKVEEILRIGMQAASGLAAAHAQGLVHRDIKPSNILLENGVERVKITDFGLARVVHEAKITKTGVVAGTPEYMSPEQARGEDIDRRSDLFSLGCVMYAMCTGRSPFRATTVTGAIHRVCEDTPRPIRETNPDIPDWLTGIIDRLLAKSPEDRFQTAGEIAEVLGQYLSHVQQPSRVEMPTFATHEESRRQERIRPAWRKFGASAACLALIAVVVFVVVRSNSLPTAPEGYSFVDLRSVANLARTDPTDRPGNNLAELPEGVSTFAGIPFFVFERYIHLGGDSKHKTIEALPRLVKSIPVGHRAESLHFLHSIQGCGANAGMTVARYTIHYGDGTAETIRVVHGEDLWDWFPVGGHDPAALTRGQMAWAGSNEQVRDYIRMESNFLDQDPNIRLYRSEWVNPHPDKEIASLDYEGANAGAPFCIAITCQHSKTTQEPLHQDKTVPSPGDKRLSSVDLIPPTDEECYSFVDLQGAANLQLADPTDSPANNLAEFPTGKRTFAGVPFFVADRYIHLGGPVAYSRDLQALPRLVKDVRVSRQAEVLHFLHSVQGCGAKAGITVARYKVHYVDDSVETIEVVHGEDLWDWYPLGNHDPAALTNGRVAWSGSNEQLREHARQRSRVFGTNPKLTLYRSHWLNPHPDKEITSLDYAGALAGAPFCIAITCQHSEATQKPPHPVKILPPAQ